MNDAILYFTFSPIQPFIGEARRAEDLFSGSSILAQLAKAAASKMGRLVYPASLENDAPNVLVTCVPADQAEMIGKSAQAAFYDRWVEIAESARSEARLPEDATWQAIWERQTDPQRVWQVYWAAAEMTNGYATAYKLAQSTVDAMKRSRVFAPATDEGEKDTLSGQRSALHDNRYPKARDYWKNLPKRIRSSKVRPGGAEKLDSIGLIKRFFNVPDKPHFPSTSSVAVAAFLDDAQNLPHLALYGYVLKALLGEYLDGISPNKLWPYDGLWLYEESLALEALQETGLEKEDIDPAKLQNCKDKLRAVHEACGKPPAYYAILVFDGDGMGKAISDILAESTTPEEYHRKFSERVGRFAAQAKDTVKSGGGFGIYIGGDDVLCMAPISKVIPLAQELARLFEEFTGNTASAGIAIAHRRSPLGHALEAARSAEKIAKKLDGKAALAVSVLRRSGEPLTVRTKWVDLGRKLEDLQKLFKDDAFSSRLPYAMRIELPAISGADMPEEARISALKYLVRRHSSDKLSPEEHAQWVKDLHDWSNALRFEPNQSSLDEMTNWLILARFLSSGGEE